MSKTVLYLSYTGLLEPLGQSQVYRYLEKLADTHTIHLITYEKPDDWADTQRMKTMREKNHDVGIRWHPLPYHKEPSALATLWDILRGLVRGAALCHRHDVEIVHARSYVSSVLALAFKQLFGTAFIFDMRGFWADERVEGGLWKEDSWLYRTAKWFETQFLRRADTVVSLTEAGIEAIKAFDHVDTRDTRFEMIPTCVDLDLFTPRPERRQDAFVLGYVGSVGTWYCFDDVLDCFQILRERQPDARLRILNQGDHDYIADRLSEKGIDRTAVTTRAVDHEGVPVEMNQMDVGIFFYRPTFSKKGTSPTKMGEFLACGIPCLCNTGVGDVKTILEGNRVGVALDSFAADEKERGVNELIDLASHEGIMDRCRALADDYYSLDAGVTSYDAVYRTVEKEG